MCIWNRSSFLGKKESTDFIKTLVKKYEGGSVDLVKSECGVAHVVLNNPERRNAMSGSMMVDLLEVSSNNEMWRPVLETIISLLSRLLRSWRPGQTELVWFSEGRRMRPTLSVLAGTWQLSTRSRALRWASGCLCWWMKQQRDYWGFPWCQLASSR